MTVYVAFPVLVTTAIFSMDIVTPKQPWAVLGGVLVTAFVLNVLIANLLEQPWAQPDAVKRMIRGWLS
jgi:CBS-domain-containing membrane protein